MHYWFPYHSSQILECYLCVACHKPIREYYAPYCGWCGQQQPSEQEMIERELCIRRARTASVQSIRDLAEQDAFLRSLKGRPAGVWCYAEGLAGLQIHVNLGGVEVFDRNVVVIKFTGTDAFRFRRLRWDVDFSPLKMTIGEFRDEIILEDPTAGVRVKCGALIILHGFRPA